VSRANWTPEETSLVDGAIAWLQSALPQTLTVERSKRVFAPQAPSRETQQTPLEGGIDIRVPQGIVRTFAVEAKESLPPRAVDTLVAGVARILQVLAGNTPILVVSRWLSTRTQEMLAERGINYIDLTGNAFISVDNPVIYIKSAGATRDPEPRPRGRAQVRGAKAIRLVRVLADVRPPYGVRDLAAAASLAPGYVSRLLDTLDREALIERSQRGKVTDVDVVALLHRVAESYDLLKTNQAVAYVAPPGAADALARLGRRPTLWGGVAVTGSFAAVRYAPVAAPSLLAIYCQDPSGVAREMALLPAEEGANVMLLEPFDPVVWERTVTDADIPYVAPAQVALDCLTGTGRMPAEGDALLAWMLGNEPRWRERSLVKILKPDSP